jgi:hypothetical protein
VKKITLVNLLNDDSDDERIAGTIVKRRRRHGKNGGSAEMEMKDEITFRHRKRPIVTLFDEFRQFVLLRSEVKHFFVSGYSKAL